MITSAFQCAPTHSSSVSRPTGGCIRCHARFSGSRYTYLASFSTTERLKTTWVFPVEGLNVGPALSLSFYPNWSIHWVCTIRYDRTVIFQLLPVFARSTMPPWCIVAGDSILLKRLNAKRKGQTADRDVFTEEGVRTALTHSPHTHLHSLLCFDLIQLPQSTTNNYANWHHAIICSGTQEGWSRIREWWGCTPFQCSLAFCRFSLRGWSTSCCCFLFVSFTWAKWRQAVVVSYFFFCQRMPMLEARARKRTMGSRFQPPILLSHLPYSCRTKVCRFIDASVFWRMFVHWLESRQHRRDAPMS